MGDGAKWMGRLAVAGVLGLGCHEDDADAPAFAGEYVAVYAEPELAPCGGTLAHMDAFVVALAQEFALALPSAAERIRFHWETTASVAARCGGDVVGCVIDSEAFAASMPLNHELVHVVAEALGQPPAFLREGLAVAYEGLGAELFGIGWAPEEPDLRALVTMSGFELAGLLGVYELVGGFTAFLIETYGLPAYLRVYGGLATDASSAEVDAVFREVFGDSFEETVVAFEADASGCAHQRFDAKLIECAAPEVAWDGASYSERVERACDQDDAIGPYGEQPPYGDQLLVLRTITIPTTGTYELRMAGDDAPSTALPDTGYIGGQALGVSLIRCGACDEGGWLTTRRGDSPRAWKLPAGRYALRVHAPASEPAEVGFSLTRVADDPP